MFFTGEDDFTRLHAQYLEARLIGLAKSAKRANLSEQGNTPTLPALGEVATAEMENVLRELLLIVPMLGLDVFQAAKAQEGTEEFLLEGPDTAARGARTTNGFLVRSGASARASAVPALDGSSSLALRDELKKQHVLAPADDGTLELSQDYEFNSPSQAAQVLLGSSVNGRSYWKTPNGQTLADVEAAESG